MTNLSHPASFHSNERIAPSNRGIKQHRNRIERTIGKLKQLRRIATRYDRIPANYLAGLYLASLSFWS